MAGITTRSRPTAEAVGGRGGSIRSLVPARLDRLPWSGFHTRLIGAGPI